MTPEQHLIYIAGYEAYEPGIEPENVCPYDGMDAEFWYDGWEDAKEDGW